ncbi:YdeI/OmpD-associated family protein [Paenibacillus glycanilyticus]|uniref:YdeI/OmpD-associated family protein n=1 Tax=Paenibacillus glycanilyticus TaxID=126569 RepID=UPI00203A8519|nr:YdeI/OmpD-associated family protein [Paenibacillus glycanilyticus]MCM3630614.1 YdeI/OmpD-associated family protein [Paenibacillus glycanilyticus]
MSKLEQPILFFANPPAFEEWLAKQYDLSTGIWMQLAKKNASRPSITYHEALDIALCYGWIDSHKKAHDEESWLQRFSPRGPKSIWSQINKDKAEVLIASGKMQPSGFKAIETAKQNGLWEKAYESQSNATVPEDFAHELARSEKAQQFFEALDKQNRYAILFRIHNAKKQETRIKRIAQFIDMLEKGEKIYPSSK